MKHNSHQFHCGLKDGIPIGLGYLAVSFTFGIMARGAGLTTLQSVVMSFTNLTSAGQFAALGIIQAGAPFMEMAVAQLIINLRYCLMSCSLSQKLGADMPFFHRFFMSYGVTDEIFGVSVCRPGFLSPFYSYGSSVSPYPAGPRHPVGSCFRGTASGTPFKRPERGTVRNVPGRGDSAGQDKQDSSPASSWLHGLSLCLPMSPCWQVYHPALKSSC